MVPQTLTFRKKIKISSYIKNGKGHYIIGHGASFGTNFNDKHFAKHVFELKTVFRKKNRTVISEFFRNVPNASKRIQMHPNASEQVRTGPNRSETFEKRANTSNKSRNIRTNFENKFKKSCLFFDTLNGSILLEKASVLFETWIPIRI